MVRWCRILVLVMVGFYAATGGLISSPLAAIGAGCAGDATGAGSTSTGGCDPACPPSLCIVAPYVAAVPMPPTTALTIEQVDYVAAAPQRLASHTPDPALRPPNA